MSQISDKNRILEDLYQKFIAKSGTFDKRKFLFYARRHDGQHWKLTDIQIFLTNRSNEDTKPQLKKEEDEDSKQNVNNERELEFNWSMFKGDNIRIINSIGNSIISNIIIIKIH